MILAGGETDEATRAQTGVTLRCDLKFGSGTILERVVGAVEGLGRTVLVGGHEGLCDDQIAAGGTFVDSLEAALGMVRTDEFLLVLADLPFLTKESVVDFVENCPAGADLAYPIVPMETCRQAYPGVKRTGLRLRQGEFTGGNICMMTSAGAAGILPVLRRAYAARKSPLQLGRIVGFGMLSTLLAGRFVPSLLDIAKLEARVSKVFGCQIRAVRSTFAEIGTDVDNLDQYLALIALQSGQSLPTR